MMTILWRGTETPRCGNCGLVLATQHDESQDAGHQMTCVVFAEDSPGVRRVIATVLEGTKITLQAIPCENGMEFIAKMTELLKEKKHVDLAILDVQMPILSGIQAALAMREIEKKFVSAKPTPILFFTSKMIDPKFKSILDQCRPSAYLNKGTEASPRELGRRIYSVVRRLVSDMSLQEELNR
ncbi:MAG: response regulator [Nitrospirae bacterium]|nr:response regulator [Nitrospirota bacterium]